MLSLKRSSGTRYWTSGGPRRLSHSSGRALTGRYLRPSRVGASMVGLARMGRDLARMRLALANLQADGYLEDWSWEGDTLTMVFRQGVYSESLS